MSLERSYWFIFSSIVCRTENQQLHKRTILNGQKETSYVTNLSFTLEFMSLRFQELKGEKIKGVKKINLFIYSNLSYQKIGGGKLFSFRIN